MTERNTTIKLKIKNDPRNECFALGVSVLSTPALECSGVSQLSVSAFSTPALYCSNRMFQCFAPQHSNVSVFRTPALECFSVSHHQHHRQHHHLHHRGKRKHTLLQLNSIIWGKLYQHLRYHYQCVHEYLLKNKITMIITTTKRSTAW